jgi:hypothetical protein
MYVCIFVYEYTHMTQEERSRKAMKREEEEEEGTQRLRAQMRRHVIAHSGISREGKKMREKNSE